MFHLNVFYLIRNSREYLQKAFKGALPWPLYVFLDNQLLLREVGLHYSEIHMKEGNMLLHWTDNFHQLMDQR